MTHEQTQSKMPIREYATENMFCLPRGVLGRVGGTLMSLDRGLPAWVVELLEIEPADTVLEVGSGPGVGLELAAARAYEGLVVGLDPSATMLEMAQRRNRARIEAGRVEQRLGTVDRLPFGNGTFDKAMTMNSLHLWPDPVAGLKEVRRTLRRGGRMAVAITRFSHASPDKFEQQLMDSGFAGVTAISGDKGICALARA